VNFYNSTHRHYCGVDLHARSLYVCILNQQGETLLHKEIPASPDALHRLIQPYLDDLVVGVECMHCWYWALTSVKSKALLLFSVTPYT